jgi:parallel beta-helix repeat protein
MNRLLAQLRSHRFWRKAYKKQNLQIVVIVLVALIGMYFLAASFAASPFGSVEPENGTNNGATVITDSTASGGGAIKFGSAATFYVATTGSDTAAGTSSAPWKTIQHAVDTAPAGAKISVLAGSYTPFKVTRANLQVVGASAATVTITGAAGVRDVVLISANNVTVSNLTVTGCVPNSNPIGGFEDQPSTGVRVDDGTSGAVVSGMTIANSDTTLNTQGLKFGCYGVFIHNATNATIDGNNIHHNGYGVDVVGGGGGVVIKNNQIHDNDVIIRNNTTANDDFGAVAIGFAQVTGTPGPVAENNTIYNNQGPSNDYGTDGGGFEIFNASNLVLRGNTIYNNENILETGTQSGGSCKNNAFTGNNVSGKSSGSTIANSIGMILRCAQNMTIDNNTISKINWWVFDIEQDSTFGASIDGLTITNNTIDQTPASGTTSEKTYSLNVNPAGHGMNINTNHYRFQNQFANDWTGANVISLAAWRTLTGFDANSTQF